MAQLQIEVVPIGSPTTDNLETVISLLNRLQDAFTFRSLVDDTTSGYVGRSNDHLTTTEIYDLHNSLKQRIKGYHPHIIGVVEHRLDGKRLSNLFGSMKQEDAQLQGMAITSLHQIPMLLDPIPITVYIVFELLSFAVRFLYGQGLIHHDTLG
jgi:hypothetical protein